MTTTEGTDSDTTTNIYYSPDYIASSCSFDTVQKAGWVAASLERRPIPGIRLVAPEPLTQQQLAQVHAPEYVEAVRTGNPRELASPAAGRPLRKRTLHRESRTRAGEVA